MRKNLLSLGIFLALTACGTDENGSSTSALQGPPYLALGDSIAFGYSPLIEMEDVNVNAGLFIGYPEFLSQKLGYQVTNASCSGESSASIVDREAKDNGCHSGDDRFDEHLKVEYSVSQLEFATDFLLANPNTKLVTVSIGGNDLLIAERECDLQRIPALCKVGRIPGVVVNFGKNILKVVKGIRATGYTGQLVFVTNYARNYKDIVQKLAIGLLNTETKAIGHFHGFKVASGFEAFDKASKAFDGDICKAGLSIPLAEGGCDQHPSAKGREILAQTILDVLR